MSEQVELLAKRLMLLSEQIHHQSLAIQALANSNMMLVEAMAEADGEEELPGTELGLNGKPLS